MENEKIIRVHELQPGDIFRKGTVTFKVLKIEGGKVYFENPRSKCWYNTMGANSMERLILITNKTKQNEHQN